MSQTQNQYVFQYPWETVIKGFWSKYPSQEMNFVKFNNVIDMQLLPNQDISFKRLMYTKFQKFIWAYSVEEIIIKFDEKVMEMKTELIQKSSLFPPLGAGAELIKYQAFDGFQTLYEKSIKNQESTQFLKKYMDKFSDSFKKGCQIVEDRCVQNLQQENKK
ncbi:hypothetical protein PPERSA_04771 [Pseudocohnilembus persalinus]|uniref:PRELI/MSF1 domain-containing protein n=1 Tax=Pseudocohnilembus persalinus TaxID=266149 RepID=A0A0V0QPG0_PSEPJ|nr:hypothetical protein PPERSA_04771 [Pseudocohnilembus persalinus]|eukprot:KRX03893.1 hypothetical protein PPERSA_04771 [Pseudocohnilembus persalinus]